MALFLQLSGIYLSFRPPYLMHFYRPRRHRRKLLFPPGLLALAGLLWLGCLALRPWQDALKPRSVLQFTMLPLHPGSIWAGHPLLLPPSKINEFRPWRDAILKGDKNTSARLPQRTFIINAVRTMVADSAHTGGVRIHFAPSAQYSDFVVVLDLMERENVKQYWLDNRHGPATFYAYTNTYNPSEKYFKFERLGGDIMYYTPHLCLFGFVLKMQLSVSGNSRGLSLPCNCFGNQSGAYRPFSLFLSR